VEVVAYLEDDATPEDVELASSGISALAAVREVRFVSKDEALGPAIRDLREFEDVFTNPAVNPLPAPLEAALLPGLRRQGEVEAVAQQLAAFPFVEDVSFGGDWVGGIITLRRIAAAATVVIGGAFAAVAGIIIAAAVRIAVTARRDEIQIMRLVGATNGF